MNFKSRSVLISCIFLVSTAVSFFSQVLITRFFGATLSLDNFLLAVTIPTLLVTVLYGTINDSFLPLYGEKFKSESLKERFFSSHVFFAFSLLSFFSLLFWLFPEMSLGIFLAKKTIQPQVVELFKILIWILPFAGVVALYGSRAYAEKRLFRFPLAQTLGALANILFITSTYRSIGIWSLVIGFFMSIFVQLVFVWKPFLPHISWAHIKPTLLLFTPLVIGTIALRSDVFFIRSLSSVLAEGAVVQINLVSRMFSMAAGLATIGLHTALFPRLVEELRDSIGTHTLSLVFRVKVLSIVIGIVIYLLGFLIAPTILRYLLVGSSFTLDDWQQMVNYFPYFALPTIGWAALTSFLQPLYVVKKQWWVGFIGIFSLALSVIIYWLGVMNSIQPMILITLCVSTLLIGSCVLAEIAWQTYVKRVLHVV